MNRRDMTWVLQQLQELQERDQLNPEVWQQVMALHDEHHMARPGFDVWPTDMGESAITSVIPASSAKHSPTFSPPTVDLQPFVAGAGSAQSSLPVWEGQWQIGDCLAERYYVLALLGQGGGGQVYLVYDELRQHVVAAKCLHDSRSSATQEARLRRELLVNEKLTHAGIVRTYTLERSHRGLFLTMEYVAGHSLAQQLQMREAMAWELWCQRSLSWLQQIAEALDYAHQQGVVHRDLKPANVLVSRQGVTKLLDFGAAHEHQEGSYLPYRRPVGTAYYMAPEQLQGGEISPATDVYALAVLAFQLLTGHLPQPGMPGPSVLQAEIPAAVDHVMAAGMHWLPAARISRAGQWIQQLQQALLSQDTALSVAHLAPQTQTTASDLDTPHEKVLQRARYRTSLRKEPGQTAVSAVALEPSTPPILPERDHVGSPGFSGRRLRERIALKRPAWLESGVQARLPVWSDDPVDGVRDSVLPPTPALPDRQRRYVFSQRGKPLLEFVWIPQGSVTMGADPSDKEAAAQEGPLREVEVDGFWIARTPVTNLMWHTFVEESGYSPGISQQNRYYLRHWGTSGAPDTGLWHRPVVWLTYLDAWAFCDFYGLSLPTENQWEKAACGIDHRRFPWGTEEPSVGLCNCNGWQKGVVDVGQFPQGASPYGVLDCAGNVFEWCTDRWQPRPWEDTDPVKAILPRHAKDRVSVRGGHYNAPAALMRCSYRQAAPLSQGNPHTGFRPVLDWRS